jgi:tetratricopeptide (TPR) repeat protein
LRREDLVGKKCNIKIILSILGIVVGITVSYIIVNLWSKYKCLAIEVDHLKSRIGNEVINIPQEIEFYSNITDSVISRINSAVTILSAIAVVFGLLGIVFTVITYLKNKEIEEKVQERMKAMEAKIVSSFDEAKIKIENQQSEMDKRVANNIDEAKSMIEVQRLEIDQINTMQHILYADRHRKFKKFDYALEEYLDALNIDEKNHLILYELGALYADEYATNPTELIFAMAHDYLSKAILSRKRDNKLLSDCYLTLGGLYGQRAKIDNKKSDYKTSIKYFQKSIKCNNSNIDAYTNMALSYICDGNKQEGLNFFKLAKEIDDKSYIETKGMRRYHNVDELLAILGKENPKEIEGEIKKVEEELKGIGEESDTRDKEESAIKLRCLKEKGMLVKVKSEFKLTLRDLFEKA